jgi:glucosamine--fructose-6-phosphate aminotransferase (isomerizing)
MIDVERIQGTYWKDMLEQPRALVNTVTRLAPVPALQSVRENLRAGLLHRIVLTGMGGSFQILHPLHLRLIACGFDTVLAETSELLYAMPALLDARNVIIAVSQSGASAEIVRLLDREGPLFVGISNTPESPLATRSHVTVLTEAGEEGGVSCKTAVTSLAALHWVGEHFAQGDLEAARRTLESAAPTAEAYLSHWRDHVSTLAAMLAGVKHVFFAGRGTSLAAVGLGAMVQKEAAHFHGEGMSSAALRHGPFEMLGPESFVVVFEGGENVRDLNRGLVRDVLSTGASAALCGFGTTEGPFALPRAHEAVRPILELLPTQMMSLALGYLQGREPGKFERITKITTVE